MNDMTRLENMRLHSCLSFPKVLDHSISAIWRLSLVFGADIWQADDLLSFIVLQINLLLMNREKRACLVLLWYYWALNLSVTNAVRISFSAGLAVQLMFIRWYGRFSAAGGHASSVKPRLLIAKLEHLIVPTAGACLDKRSWILIEQYLMVLFYVIISIDIAGRFRRQRLVLWIMPWEDYVDLIITIEVIICSARFHEVFRIVAIVSGLARGAVILHRHGFRQIGLFATHWVAFKVPICSIHDFSLVGFYDIASHRIRHDRLPLFHLVRGIHELFYGLKR